MSATSDSVLTAVNQFCGMLVGLGSGDLAKAQRAAKRAGQEAKKLEEKKYPSWDLKSTRQLAQTMGITTRAEWKKARAEACDEAYELAQGEIMRLYEEQIDAQINALNNLTSEEQLAREAQAQGNSSTIVVDPGVNGVSKNSGCAPIIAIAFISSLTIIISMLC